VSAQKLEDGGDEASVRRRFAAAGQDHVGAHLDRLDRPRRAALLAQLATVDLDLLQRLVAEMKRDRPIVGLDIGSAEPPDWLALERVAGSDEERRARRLGEERLAAGKVAALVVAGGQGTRLGFDGPKGCFEVGPLSRRSLFAWHAGKVLAARRRFGARIPFLVLTSQANDEATREFFAAQDHFGLPADDVMIFRQGMLPAVDFEGKLLFEAEDRLALAPDGHGGTLTALAASGTLDALEARGIEDVFYFQVDNPLVKVLDPAFLGHHHERASQVSSKACRKRDAAEKVGVFASSEGRLGIIEYSDLPAEMMNARAADGDLRFRAGNIAIHVFAIDFVRRLTQGGLRLPYHRAIKSVPYVDANFEVVTPSHKNAVKFETFVFDALPLAERTLVLETAREEEFSPIKNREGEDSPATARRDLDAAFRRWLATAAPGAAPEAIEIAPSFAFDVEEFAAKVAGVRDLASRRLLLE
jgi:UDP-N-acetylglucosamine/UDP-N-acetylgalactosamine diphosphorylase